MNLIVVILSLVLLITLHELGHFLFAKKFDVKVHEFGIGIPPRMIGKKIGETIYSINWIPLGGFVRMLGEDEKVEDQRSFSQKPIWQRAIILVAGVVSFWLVAMLIFAVVSFGWGVTRVELGEGDFNEAFLVGRGADNIFIEALIDEGALEFEEEKIVNSEQFNDIFSKRSKADFQREGDNLTIELLDESLIGSLRFGATQTVHITRLQAGGLWMALRGALVGDGLPEGVELGGPVMIGDMATDALDSGVGDYLMFVGMIATVLAFMNILPIPALDGGRLLFLAVEKVKGSPIPERVERNVNAAFFVLLLALMIAITIRDIVNIF